jgi:hypothetical protein
VVDVWIRLKPRLCLAPSPIGAICLVDGTRTVVAAQDQRIEIRPPQLALACRKTGEERLDSPPNCRAYAIVK